MIRTIMKILVMEIMRTIMMVMIKKIEIFFEENGDNYDVDDKEN